jgi:hypothetical protein
MKTAAAGLALLFALVPTIAVTPMPPPRGAVVRDSALAVAREAIAEGRPWRATRVLAPMLRDSTLRTPEVELVAAKAAAGWHGWRRPNSCSGMPHGSTPPSVARAGSCSRVRRLAWDATAAG